MEIFIKLLNCIISIIMKKFDWFLYLWVLITIASIKWYIIIQLIYNVFGKNLISILMNKLIILDNHNSRTETRHQQWGIAKNKVQTMEMNKRETKSLATQKYHKRSFLGVINIVLRMGITKVSNNLIPQSWW